MAIRNPKAAAHQPRSRQVEPLDLSQVPELTATPELIAEKSAKLRELLDEWDRELGPPSAEDLEAVERAWPGSL